MGLPLAVTVAPDPINTDWSLTYRLMYILEIHCRGSTVGELSKIKYDEDQIIISPLFFCISLNFLQKAIVQYTIFKTVLLYLLKNYLSNSL